MPKLSTFISPLSELVHENFVESQARTQRVPHVVQIPDEELADHMKKAEATYSKRLSQYGPRVYRHSDGTLKSHKPVTDHYTLVHRYNWSELIDWSRRNGGLLDIQKTGYSLRYNVNVTEGLHRRYLDTLGLEVEERLERDIEVSPSEDDPLNHSSHPFMDKDWGPIIAEVLGKSPYQWHFCGQPSYDEK